MLGNSPLLEVSSPSIFSPVCGFSSSLDSLCRTDVNFLIKFSLSVTSFKDGGIGGILSRLLSSRFV